MKKIYKDLEIEIKCEAASIRRRSDGWVLADTIKGSPDDDEPVLYEEMLIYDCQELINEYLAHPERFEDEAAKGWEQFAGDYEKQEYDIRLQDNRIVKNCWPNAGNFHVLLASDTEKVRRIEGSQVKAIRVSEPTSFEILTIRRKHA
jgi:hypothetical protein